MDAISFVVRAVCQEVGIQSPIATHRIESRVLEALAAQYGGEELRIYVAKMPLAERSRRHRAILTELLPTIGNRVNLAVSTRF